MKEEDLKASVPMQTTGSCRVVPCELLLLSRYNPSPQSPFKGNEDCFWSEVCPSSVTGRGEAGEENVVGTWKILLKGIQLLKGKSSKFAPDQGIGKN